MKKAILFPCLGLLILSCSPRTVVTDSGLQYTILRSGSGSMAKLGDDVLIFETTTYRNGTVLYSNDGTDSPVKVKIGANQATKAVDEGLRGMKAGEVRQLVAKPELVRRTGYPPNVSPDSTLVITMRLFKILGN